jgi:hypothetical protein
MVQEFEENRQLGTTFYRKAIKTAGDAIPLGALRDATA